MEKIAGWLRQWVSDVEMVGNGIRYSQIDGKKKREYFVLVSQPSVNRIFFDVVYGKSELLDKHVCSRSKLNELVYQKVAGRVTEKGGYIHIQVSFLADEDDDYNQIAIYDCWRAIQALWDSLNAFFDNLNED